MSISSQEYQTLRDALIRLRASGVRVMMYDGRRLEYGTDAELATAIADLDAKISASSGTPRQMAIFTTFNRG